MIKPIQLGRYKKHPFYGECLKHKPYYFHMPVHLGGIFRIVFILREKDFDFIKNYLHVEHIEAILGIVARCIYEYLSAYRSIVNFIDIPFFAQHAEKHSDWDIDFVLTISMIDIHNALSAYFKGATQVQNFEALKNIQTMEDFLLNALFHRFPRPEQNENGHLVFLSFIENEQKEIIQENIKLYPAFSLDSDCIKGHPILKVIYQTFVAIDEAKQGLRITAKEAEEAKEYVVSTMPECYKHLIKYNYLYTPEYEYLRAYNGFQLIRIFYYNDLTN